MKMCKTKSKKKLKNGRMKKFESKKERKKDPVTSKGRKRNKPRRD